MEDRVNSVAIDWLCELLSQVDPDPLPEAPEAGPNQKLLGIESDGALRMKSLIKRLRVPLPEYPKHRDPKLLQTAREALEKLILLDRRITLGSAAAPVTRFQLCKGGKIIDRCAPD